MRDRRAAGMKDAAQVRIDHLLPFVAGHFGDLLENPDAGVVDQDVEAAEAGRRRIDDAGHVVATANVSLKRLDSGRACAVECFPRRRQMCGAQSGHRHLRTLGGERTSNGQTDATRPASDDRDFRLKRLQWSPRSAEASRARPKPRAPG